MAIFFGECAEGSLGPLARAHETPTWTPKVCKIMAFWAIIKGLGLLFYILLGSR